LQYHSTITLIHTEPETQTESDTKTKKTRQLYYRASGCAGQKQVQSTDATHLGVQCYSTADITNMSNVDINTFLATVSVVI